jgi:flagellar hook-associated protein FlgK
MSTSSLNSSLLIATSGLKAAQAGLDVVSRNVANSGVEGYTRKQAPLSSVVVGERGAGVRTLEIIRNVNKTILTQFQNATSSTQRYSVEDDFLARFEASFGAPGDDANISAKLGNLHNAMTALTISPDNATAQAQALSKAQAVVSDLNQVAANARALREEADSKIADSVNAVNTALIQIDDLNRQIQTLKAQSRSTADLEDQRDIQIGIVAKEMDITTSHQTTGAIFVSTRSGRALVDSTFSSTNLPLSFTSTPVILGSTAYYPPPSASYSGLSGVMLHGTDITSEIQGGRIGAYVNVRDDYMPETLSQMDELAGRLIQSFNFQDLQLFQAGTTTLPSALASTNARTSGQGVLAATPITVSSTTGLSAGMTVKFDNQSTVYEITSVINGTDFTIAQVGGTGGLTAAISNTTNIMFGPKLPQLTVGGSAYAVGAGSGSPATNVITGWDADPVRQPQHDVYCYGRYQHLGRWRTNHVAARWRGKHKWPSGCGVSWRADQGPSAGDRARWDEHQHAAESQRSEQPLADARRYPRSITEHPHRRQYPADRHHQHDGHPADVLVEHGPRHHGDLRELRRERRRISGEPPRHDDCQSRKPERHLQQFQAAYPERVRRQR